MENMARTNARATDPITFFEGSKTDRACLLPFIPIFVAFFNDFTVALRNSMLALAMDLGITRAKILSIQWEYAIARASSD